MNPPFNGPVNSQASYMPPYSQPPHVNSYNAFPSHGGQGLSKPPMPYGGGGSQNGPINNCVNQSTQQVQSAPVPPTNHIVNNQLSQDMNALHLSQNQNHPLLTAGNHHHPPNTASNHSFQQQEPSHSPNHYPPYWQQQNSAPRMPGMYNHHAPGPQFLPPNSNSSAPPPNQNSTAYGDRTAPPPNSDHQNQFQKVPNQQQGLYPPPNQMNRPPPAYSNGTGFAPPASQYGPPPNSNMHQRYPPSSLSPGTQPGNVQSNVGAVPYSQAGSGLAPQSNRMGPLPPAQPPQPPVAQQRKLDPDHMPSPIQVIEDDRNLRSGYFTSARGVVPPLVTTDFTVIDEGNCSPRFIRSTIYNVPITVDMLKQTSVPFALAITPFARIRDGEEPLLVVNPGEEGPVRCNRCRAYMSPFMQFIDAGRRFQCTLCKATSEVPMHYFAHLDHMGERIDKHERPELLFGSYEFKVTKDYCKEGKYPNCPAFIFLVDVSYNAVRSGMVKTLCDNMKMVLKSLPRESDAAESKIRVGFITYSSVVHFYNINGNLAQPQMLVVPDVQDMFMPLLDGFLVHVSQAEQVIDSLMEQIPLMFRESQETETLLGPAIQAGLEALKAAECAGKLFVFHSSLPISEAPGKLKNRDDRKLLRTDKEKTILTPQTTFYNNLGQECVKAGCSVDLFLFNNAYVDVATLGQVCRLTGGQLYKYTYFQADIDGERFIGDLKKNVEKFIAFDAVLRVRTSTGIRPTDFSGCFFMSNTTDVELASLTWDSTLSIEVKYDDKLNEEEGVNVQCAILYTSCSGERRLRVLNLGLNTCVQMADMFRSIELDTMMNIFLKDGVRRILEETPKQVKDHFINVAAQILACYRKNCAQASSVGQLILPECIKLLPLYMNCLIKCDALAGGQEISTDDRSFIMLSALSMDVDSSVAYLYPRLLPLHEISPEAQEIKLPVAIRCSVERLKENGVYLLENGFIQFLWMGANADSNWIQEVFGVPSVARIDVDKTHLPRLPTPLSETVSKILDLVQKSRQNRIMKLYLVRQNDKLELQFRQLLVEDRTTEGSESYVDFLCHLHKEIRLMLS